MGRGDYLKGGDEPPLLPTVCFRCGVCCTRYHVRLSLAEAKRTAAELGITWEDFHSRYIEPRWPGVESFLLIQQNGACVFLDQTRDNNQNTCLIHSFRPSACAEWTASLSRRECQEGLSRYWGLEVNSSGDIVGTRDRVERFQRFLESFKDS